MPSLASKPTIPIRTLRLKVHPDAYARLNQAATEVNQVWNYLNEVCYKAARPFYGKPRKLNRVQLCALTAGASRYFEHLGADTIQRVCFQLAQKREQSGKLRLRWRKSFGSNRSLGWIPLKSASLRRHGRYLRFLGKTIRFFESERFKEIKRWGAGCFAQEPAGDWYLCLPVAVVDQTPPPTRSAVGLDLGLKDTVVSSDGERVSAGRYYRDLEVKIACAQRRGKKRRIKALHAKARRRRRDTLHKVARYFINTYDTVIVGNVSAPKLARTKLAKAVLDTGWGMFRTMLLYKGEHAGRTVEVIDERDTTRACCACGALAGPAGVQGLRMREWICPACGITQDRDVNAARNILLAWGSPRP